MQNFWPQIAEEIQATDPTSHNFREQIIPVSMTHRWIEAEGRHLSNASPIDAGASCALSKALEIFVLHLTLNALYSSADLSNSWRLKVRPMHVLPCIRQL